MDGVRRIAVGMGVAGASVLIVLALAGAVAPQLGVMGAVAVCAGMMVAGHGTATQR